MELGFRDQTPELKKAPSYQYIQIEVLFSHRTTSSPIDPLSFNKTNYDFSLSLTEFSSYKMAP